MSRNRFSAPAEINFVSLLENSSISTSAVRVFDDQVCDFLNALAKSLLTHPPCKQYSDLMYFGYSIRKSSIQQLKSKYQSKLEKLGKGLCFHVTPSNIPINFAFSWAYSLLAGNANIVRLPTKEFPQITLLIQCIKQVLDFYPSILDRTLFVRYDKQSSASEHFSKFSDARMIWGGDQTIAAVRQLPTKARTIDITFADRNACSVIDVQALATLTKQELAQVAQRFYNDTYAVDQNACSSPQVVFWLNSNAEIKQRFWQEIRQLADEQYLLTTSSSLDKFAAACQSAIEQPEIRAISRLSNMLIVSTLGETTSVIDNYAGRCGYFFEQDLDELTSVATYLSSKTQTITYLGIEPRELAAELAHQQCSGVDRIVPIGQALAIEPVWDGHDLIDELSREITLR